MKTQINQNTIKTLIVKEETKLTIIERLTFANRKLKDIVDDEDWFDWDLDFVLDTIIYEIKMCEKINYTEIIPLIIDSNVVNKIKDVFIEHKISTSMSNKLIEISKWLY